jgi:hypothetical protein
MKSSLYSLIPSLPFLLSYLRIPSPGLDPILFSPSDIFNPFVNPRHGLHGKRRLYCSLTWQLLPYCRVRLCCAYVFTEPFTGNGNTRHIIILPYMTRSQTITLLHVSQLAIYMHFATLTCKLRTPSISPSLILITLIILREEYK